MAKIFGTNGNDYIEGTDGGDNIKGLGGNDEIYPGRGNDTAYGGGGDDVINGRWGNDKIYGEAGNDRLVVSVGNDFLDGGTGSDALDFGYSIKGVRLSLKDGRVEYFHAEGTGITTFKNMENIWGSQFDDELRGNGKVNWIAARVGNDLIDGAGGNDKIEGGLGADILYGGAGRDVFIYKNEKDSTIKASGRDTIKDFSHSQKDVIDLSSIDANKLTKGDQDFHFIGKKGFTGSAGELRYAIKKGDTFIDGDVNGDGKADISVRIDAAIDFVKADFLL